MWARVQYELRKTVDHQTLLAMAFNVTRGAVISLQGGMSEGEGPVSCKKNFDNSDEKIDMGRDALFVLESEGEKNVEREVHPNGTLKSLDKKFDTIA